MIEKLVGLLHIVVDIMMNMLQNKREIDDSFSAFVKTVMFVFSEMFNFNSFESLHGNSQGLQITCLCVYENSIPKEEGCCCCFFILFM